MCIRDRVSRWANRSRAKILVKEGRDPDYTSLLQRARFCLALDGHSTQTYRFLEALHHGCVLVVLSDHFRPPLHRALDWASAPVLFWPTSRIPTLERHLVEIP